MHIANTPTSDLCDSGVSGDLTHDLVECDFNGTFNDWILGVLINIDPSLLNCELSGVNIVGFNLPMDEDTALPVTWFLTTVFSLVWKANCARKPISFSKMKAAIEGDISILR